MDIFIHVYLLYFCPPQPRLGAIVCWNAGKVYSALARAEIKIFLLNFFGLTFFSFSYLFAAVINVLLGLLPV